MTDVSLWLPLGTAVIGAAAALAGNALGPLFGQQGEHRQWLRNKRAVLLEEFHALLERAEDDTYAYATGGPWLPPKPKDFTALNAHSRTIFEELQDAYSRAGLYVSSDLDELMSRCTYDYHVVYSSADVYDATEWADVRQGWVNDVDKCRGRIRRELKVD